MVIYGVYIRFWPTLYKSHELLYVMHCFESVARSYSQPVVRALHSLLYILFTSICILHLLLMGMS